MNCNRRLYEAVGKLMVDNLELQHQLDQTRAALRYWAKRCQEDPDPPSDQGPPPQGGLPGEASA